MHQYTPVPSTHPAWKFSSFKRSCLPGIDSHFWWLYGRAIFSIALGKPSNRGIVVVFKTIQREEVNLKILIRIWYCF